MEKLKGIKIQTYGCELFYSRHAQSMANIGINTRNTELSKLGITQATKLKGHYDVVIRSPLKRCKQTMEHSTITYDKLHVSYNFRERIGSEQDFLDNELFNPETDTKFFNRTKAFQRELEAICSENKDKKILLIGHAYYFNAWYRQGCFVPPKNANIIQLV